MRCDPLENRNQVVLREDIFEAAEPRVKPRRINPRELKAHRTDGLGQGRSATAVEDGRRSARPVDPLQHGVRPPQKQQVRVKQDDAAAGKSRHNVHELQRNEKAAGAQIDAEREAGQPLPQEVIGHASVQDPDVLDVPLQLVARFLVERAVALHDDLEAWAKAQE